MTAPDLQPFPSRIAILSPHRDDAAFSCGILMHRCGGAGVEVEIVNIFTESGYAPYFGSKDVAEITRARREEDRELLGLLTRCSLADLGLRDAPLRLGIEVEQVVRKPLSRERFDEEVRALAAKLDVLEGFHLVLLPLGLGGHVDHCSAREAGRLRLRPECMGFYEDLPYAARLTDESRATHVSGLALEAETWSWRSISMEGGAELKRKFAAVYRSQIAGDVVEEIAGYAAAISGGHGGEGGERVYLPADMQPGPLLVAKPVELMEEERSTHER